MASHRARVEVENLEDRRLMAVTVTPDAAARTLTITGSDLADTVTVAKRGGQIVVTSSSEGETPVEQTFARSTVKSIIFNGGEGDDVFTNLTTVRSTLNGEGGNDDLTGGKGKDLINGGDGDDTLKGGKGKDDLSGDAGNDVLDGGQSNDRLSGGDDNDDLTGGQGRDLLDGGNGDDTIHNRREDKLAEAIGTDVFDQTPRTKGPKKGHHKD